jgi:hypothetical protein
LKNITLFGRLIAVSVIRIIPIFLATIALTANGQPIIPNWVQTFRGPGTGESFATAIATDTNGNVFVTGASVATNGQPDYATIKYSSTGTSLWTNCYDGPSGSYDRPVALKLDSKGNVFVTGASYGSPLGADFATIAYSNSGTPLWTNRYRGSWDGGEEAKALAVDSNDDVCVVGYSDSPYAYVVIKYSNDGVPLWTNFLVGPTTTANASSAIITDNNRNVLVTTAAANEAGHIRYLSAKYSSTGIPQWTNSYVGPGDYADKPTEITVDVNGNVFVTGISYGDGTGFDFATVAYSNTGTPLWTNRFNGDGNDWDGARGIASDTNGIIFVAGYSPTVLGGPAHYATIAYSNSGLPLWTNIYSGGVGDDEPSGISVDQNGDVFVTGYSTGVGTSSDFATIKYSNTGLPLSTNRYNGPLNGADYAYAITADRTGNVFVTGLSDSGYATIKYSPLQPIPLSIEKINDNVVLRWTNLVFLLQSAPTTEGVFTNIVGATSPHTNLITGSNLFFRLQAN